jgi:hypothetical protein
LPASCCCPLAAAAAVGPSWFTRAAAQGPNSSAVPPCTGCIIPVALISLPGTASDGHPTGSPLPPSIAPPALPLAAAVPAAPAGPVALPPLPAILASIAWRALLTSTLRFFISTAKQNKHAYDGGIQHSQLML